MWFQPFYFLKIRLQRESEPASWGNFLELSCLSLLSSFFSHWVLKLSPWLPLNQLQRPNKAKLASFPFGVSRTQDTFGCFSDASSRITTALRTLHYPTVSNKVKDALTYSYAGIQSGQESANSSEQPINHLATDNQRLFFGHQWVLGLDSPWSFRRPMLLRWCSVDRRCDWCHLRVGRGTGWTLVSAPLPLWPGWAAPLPSMRRRTSSMGNGRDRCVWVDCEGTGGWLGWWWFVVGADRAAGATRARWVALDADPTADAAGVRLKATRWVTNSMRLIGATWATLALGAFLCGCVIAMHQEMTGAPQWSFRWRDVEASYWSLRRSGLPHLNATLNLFIRRLATFSF